MNYYERHIGDYLKDTAHLSLLEHGVYTRLIDVYYTREGAIPEREASRLIGARSKDEREALAAVLAEFFVLIDGAYSQKRCDEELHAYREGQEGSEDKKLNDKERQRRARERRKTLFAELRSHGVVPPWDTKMTDLQTLLSRVTGNRQSATVTQPVTRDNTATQTPDTRPSTDANASAAAKTPRATRKCPPTFEPIDPDAWIAVHAPGVDWRRETDSFRDYTFKNAITDWQGAWRNWMRKATPARSAKTSFTQDRTEQANAWIGSAARQPQQGEIIDMEADHGPRLALG